MATKQQQQFKNRILRLERIPANRLIPSKKNWRVHTPEQTAALEAVLSEIGIADVCIVREKDKAGNYALIDGHLRQGVMPETLIPTLVTDLTAAEADKMLATFDPLGSMAVRHDGVLTELLAGLKVRDKRLQELLDSMQPADTHTTAAQHAGPGASSGPVTMLQLFLTEVTWPEFDRLIDRLAEEYATETVTDTVAEAVRREASEARAAGK